MDKALERVLQRVGLSDPPADYECDPDIFVFDQLISECEYPEDVFGFEDIVLPKETLLAYLAAEYDNIKAHINPENFADPTTFELAEELTAKLERLYAKGCQKIQRQTYGMPGYNKFQRTSKSFRVNERAFFVGPRILEDEHFHWFEGFLEQEGEHQGEVEIKLSATEDDNHLAHNEMRILNILHKVNVPQWKHLPFVLDKFESGGRVGIIFRKISAYSLSTVRKRGRHRKGVDQKHVVWMIDRLFSTLGFVHSQGVLHGNINPDTVVIQPATHNVLLCDWEHAVHNPAITDERINVASEAFTAPEVKEIGKIGPWSDIYSLGKLIIWTLGGDPVNNVIPDNVEGAIADFLLSLVVEEEYMRPSDAWELFDEQCAIKDSLWPRKFLHFDMS